MKEIKFEKHAKKYWASVERRAKYIQLQQEKIKPKSKRKTLEEK